MTQTALSVLVCVEEGELECVLWAACERECVLAGDAVVSAVVLSISRSVTSDLILDSADARDAAVQLVASASFVMVLAEAYTTFVLRERRVPSAVELVANAKQAGVGREPLLRAMDLARGFLSQRTAV